MTATSVGVAPPVGVRRLISATTLMRWTCSPALRFRARATR